MHRSEVFYIPQAVRKSRSTDPAASSEFGRGEVDRSELEVFVGHKNIRTGVAKKTIEGRFVQLAKHRKFGKIFGFLMQGIA